MPESPTHLSCHLTSLPLIFQNKVTVELDYLYEIAADTVSKVGNTGNPKHSIQTFATQAFIVQDPVDTTLHDGSVHAQKVRFSSPISTIGKITLDTFILKSSGTVGTDTESWAVRANDVKFNIVLSDWDFCDPCGNGNNAASSAFIDVAVKIKGQGAAPVSYQRFILELGKIVPFLIFMTFSLNYLTHTFRRRNQAITM